MKIKVRKSDLLEALKKISPICGCKFQPIMSNVLIGTTKNGVVITGSNTIIAIKSFVICEVLENGVTTFPASKLTQIVETLSNDIELSDGLIISGKTKIKLEGLNVLDYPPQKFDIDVKTPIELDAKAILKGIEKNILTTAQFFENNILAGINFVADEGEINLYSSDGNVTSVYSIKTDIINKFNLILPSDTAKEILRIFNQSENLTICVDENAIVINDETTTIKSRLMNGVYPTPIILRVISDQRENKISIGKDYLNSIIKRCQILKTDIKGELPTLKIQTQGNKVDFSYKDVLTETTLVDTAGEDIKIGFNFDYLSIGIKNLESQNLRFEIKDKKSAAMLQEGDYKFLIMPINKE